jgi:hypothetical protein
MAYGITVKPSVYCNWCSGPAGADASQPVVAVSIGTSPRAGMDVRFCKKCLAEFKRQVAAIRWPTEGW